MNSLPAAFAAARVIIALIMIAYAAAAAGEPERLSPPEATRELGLSRTASFQRPMARGFTSPAHGLAQFSSLTRQPERWSGASSFRRSRRAWPSAATGQTVRDLRLGHKPDLRDRHDPRNHHSMEPAGHIALSPVLAPDGKRLYVCNRFDDTVTIHDLSRRTVRVSHCRAAPAGLAGHHARRQPPAGRTSPSRRAGGPGCGIRKNEFAVKRMQSFLTVQPGETSSCVGCHEQRTREPDKSYESLVLMVVRRPPSKIEPITDVPDVIDYPRDVQPVLDQLCVRCHGYEPTTAGGPRRTNDTHRRPRSDRSCCWPHLPAVPVAGSSVATRNQGSQRLSSRARVTPTTRSCWPCAWRASNTWSRSRGSTCPVSFPRRLGSRAEAIRHPRLRHTTERPN